MSSIIFKRGTPLIWHIKVYRYCGVPLHKAFCESWWSRAKQAKHTKTSDWTADCRVALWVIQTPGSDKKEKCMKLCTVQSFFLFWYIDFDCRHIVRSQQSPVGCSVITTEPDRQKHNPGLNMYFFFMCCPLRLSPYLVFFFVFFSQFI